MEWKATLATTTLLVALVPIAAADDAEAPDDAAWRCVPGQDRTATAVSLNGATYYQRIYQSGTYYVEELWQESNGEAGLQLTSGMSCTGKMDKLLSAECVGYCPVSF